MACDQGEQGMYDEKSLCQMHRPEYLRVPEQPGQ
jgi:hypothetical protein